MPDAVFFVVAKKMLDVDPTAKSSMFQDLERKQPTEIDFLQGEIIRTGRKAGVATPINSAVYKLIVERQDTREGSPALEPERLNELVRDGRPKPSMLTNPLTGVLVCLGVLL